LRHQTLSTAPHPENAIRRRTLSGGRQMVAMAKALMVDAKILPLDEPTAGLSPKCIAW
jgi:ABC-type branched-subunit amino acid transport system ATPase component